MTSRGMSIRWMIGFFLGRRAHIAVNLAILTLDVGPPAWGGLKVAFTHTLKRTNLQ